MLNCYISAVKKVISFSSFNHQLARAYTGGGGGVFSLPIGQRGCQSETSAFENSFFFYSFRHANFIISKQIRYILWVVLATHGRYNL